MFRTLAPLMLCAAMISATGTQAAEPRSARVYSTLDCFVSHEVPITVEKFAPDDDEQHPAIVFLHAIDGLETGHGPLYDRLARQFAARGYVVLLVHYFDSTGGSAADAQAYRKLFLPFLSLPPDAPEVKTCRQLFSTWVDVASDAVKFAEQLPEVDEARIGMVGFSMGAFVSLAAAGQEDSHVAAVVEFFGGLPADVTVNLKKLPPTLIVHGDRDQTVSVKEAYALHGWMKAQGLASDIAVYHGADHMFMKNEKDVDLLTVWLAQLKATNFLKKNLQKSVVQK